MKKRVQSFVHFTKAERYGILGLLVLISGLLAVRLSMHCWIRPSRNTTRENRLRTEWERLKAQKPAQAEPIEAMKGTSKPFPFDPNTLDSQGFILLGLHEKTVHYLLNWRRKGKKFRRPADLKPLYTLTEGAYRRLEPFIRIEASWEKNRYTHYEYYPMESEIIDLNTADSVMLVRLNGIGPVLSHRILERRKALGGFINIEQLKEIHRFSDTAWQMLSQRMKTDATAIHQMDLNSVQPEELKSHPYVGEKMGKNIILFREGIKQFENINQLRQVPLMNEEIYRKIAPYFTIE